MNKIRKLPDTELQIMLVIWNAGKQLHTGEIASALGSNCKLQTVQNLMSRLQEKGYVSCEKQGKYNYYTAIISESSYREFETQTLLKRFYKNSSKNLIAALAQEKALTSGDLEAILNLLKDNTEN